MKKLPIILLLLSLFATEKGIAQCTPDNSIVQWGIYPSSDSLPCIERNVPYSQELQFKVFDFVDLDSVSTTMGFPMTIDSIVLDSIGNLPAGINYQVGKRTYLSNEVGCLLIQGTTSAPAGQYDVEIYVTMHIQGILTGPQSGTLSSFYSSLGALGSPSLTGANVIPRFVKVINAGQGCTVFATPKRIIAGSVIYDVNNNGVLDSTDGYMANTAVTVDPGNIQSHTDAAGNYSVYLDSGSYTVSLTPPQNFALSTIGSHVVSLTGSTQQSTGNDFGLYPTTLLEDVEVTITGTFARPGFLTTHWISYQNVGTTVANGTISYQHDAVMWIVASTVPHTTQNGNQLTWDYTGLYPGEQRTIKVTLQIPIDNNLRGDTLLSSVLITPTEIPRTSANNKAAVEQVVTGSYDPNDKLVEPGNKAEIAPDQLLTYTIRFQNTGTDTAFTVVIRDTLDSNLDVHNFKTIATSHPASFQLEGGKYAIWTFNNILLPDSFVNEKESHGFVKFAILPKENLADQTSIYNSASIYFDFNDPVKTNTTNVKVDLSVGIREPLPANSARIFPNPSNSLFTLTLEKPVKSADIAVYDITGNELVRFENNSGSIFAVDLNGYPEGIYFYQISAESGTRMKGKLVLMR